jgi:hypothetical protein
MMAWILTVPLALAYADPPLQQQYLDVYLKINEAQHFEQQGDNRSALKDFEDCYTQLVKIHEADPHWESALVGHRLEDCKAKILELESKTAAHPPGTPTQNASSPANATNSTDGFVFPPFAKKARTNYQWKTNIITTMFWIGEGGSHTSAWDDHWQASNRGSDDPDNRNGYAPADHAPTANTFYVALPFNDLAFPEMARQWVPWSWQQSPRNGKPVSACKDRWVEIKNEQGRSCFAQWEDVGPLRKDHAEYVFGDELPGPGATAGLSVSPAVAQYLTIDGTNRITSWRFVEPEDMLPGQWLRYDELALLYRAMHQTQK